MANENEVKFTAKVEDNASPAIKKLADSNEELAQSADSASKSIEQLENAQQNASGTAEQAAQAHDSASSAQENVAESAGNAAQANDDLSNANAQAAQSAENSAQAAEQEAQAKDKAAKSAENLAEKQQKATGSTNVLQQALERVKRGFAMDVVIGNLITQGINLAISAFMNLGSAIVDCVYKFANAEMINARLEASLRNQGITSAYVAQELNEYAQSMQRVYGVSDDVIKNGMRLLVNFGVVGDELKQATNSAYALSQGLGIDLQSAFQMVARAAEGNTTALSRYGIKVDTTKSQTEQFAQALEQIDAKFGNLADSTANNLITKTNVLKETWGDFQKQFGEAVGSGQGLVDVLIWGVDRLKDGLRILQNYYARVFEEIIIGVKKFQLFFEAIMYGTQAAKVGIYELGNALHLVSDETVEAAKKELEAKKASMNMTSQTIDLLENQKTAIFDLSKATHEASEAEKQEAAQQVAAAKARMEAEKAAEEAKKKADEEAKKRAEQDARDAENRAKRVSDYKLQTHMAYLDAIAELEKAQTGYEQAEILARTEQDYQAKRTALENQIAYLAEHNANEINSRLELQEQLKVLEDEYALYQAQVQAEAEQRKLSFNALDKLLADERTKNAMNSLNYISQLQNAKSKEMAAVGKAAAVMTATVDTYKAANAAYSAMAGIPIVGPALGAAAAAAAIATGLMNVGKIVGIQLAVGTPYVPEDMAATIHKGEIVVPATFAEGLRSGDLALSSPETFLQETENRQETSNTMIFNFNGDVLSDSSDSITEKLHQKMSESIAGGRFAPFPTGERM